MPTQQTPGPGHRAVAKIRPERDLGLQSPTSAESGPDCTWPYLSTEAWSLVSRRSGNGGHSGWLPNLAARSGKPGFSRGLPAPRTGTFVPARQGRAAVVLGHVHREDFMTVALRWEATARRAAYSPCWT